MSRDWTVLRWQFFCLILLGVLFVDGRHHQDDNQVVHRHRHRHESPTSSSSLSSSKSSSKSSRWHHNYPRSWRDDEDYEDADDESENDYHSQLYSRSYLKNYRDKYDARHLPYYRDKQTFSTRRRKTHFGSRARNHRIRPSRDRTRKNSWDYDDDEEEDMDYYDDYDKSNRYDNDDSNEDEEFYPIRRTFRKHRMGDYDSDDSKVRLETRWKFKNSIRKDDRSRQDRRRKFTFRNTRNRFHDLDDDANDRFSKKNTLSKLNVTRHDYDKTFDDDLFLDDEENITDDDDDDNNNNNNEPDDYDDDTWYPKEERRRYSKTNQKYPDRKHQKTKSGYNFPKYSPEQTSAVENKYLDTLETVPDYSTLEEVKDDFYENSVQPSMKKYDDIIRRLTSNDPTTPKTEARRDYRNIEIGKYLKRDAYGNLKYEPKNNNTKVDVDFVTIGNIETTTVKREENLNRIDGEITIKVVPDVLNLTKSSEQDYDYGGNEQDDDPTTQTDGNNADYGDDENDEDDDNNTLKTSTTSEATTMLTTSTTTMMTTTTTTTTPKPTEAVFFPKSMTNYERSSTGAQYNGYQSKNDYPPMSAHSVQKWKHLGSRESVKETRDKYPEFKNNGKSAEVNEALQHAIKVSREGSCQWPRARIVPVRDVYPSTSTTYIPHCAILHRCSDDTGCCRSEALTCVPKQSHRVELYFYTTNLEGSSVVEKLTFYNHTECECRERTEVGVKVEKTAETRFARHHPPIIPQNLRKLPPKKPCRCPSEFLPKITPDGECQCKCSDTDQNCIRTRRGKVYFSIRDRLCIHNGDCTQPICEFGEYMSRQGKCPRKQEQYSFYSKYHTNIHHGQRS